MVELEGGSVRFEHVFLQQKEQRKKGPPGPTFCTRAVSRVAVGRLCYRGTRFVSPKWSRGERSGRGPGAHSHRSRKLPLIADHVVVVPPPHPPPRCQVRGRVARLNFAAGTLSFGVNLKTRCRFWGFPV